MSTRSSDDGIAKPDLAGLAFRWLLVPCLAVMVGLGIIDLQLQSGPTGHGIVSLELCALIGSCEEILGGWSSAQREYAMLSLGADFLFLVLYSAVIASALLLLGRRLPGIACRLSRAQAWMVVGAGVMDALENYCLVRLLATGQVEVFALPAALLASVKFAIIGLALLWLLGAAAWLLWRRGKP